jgi:transcriptional regulator with XRE-family HTH domain
MPSVVIHRETVPMVTPSSSATCASVMPWSWYIRLMTASSGSPSRASMTCIGFVLRTVARVTVVTIQLCLVLSRVSVLDQMPSAYAEVRWPLRVVAPTVLAMAEGESSEDAEYRRRVGNVLAKMRHAADLTQLEAGEAIGVDMQTISRWENGHRAVRVTDLAKMVRLYQPPAEGLMYLFDPPPLPRSDLDVLLGVPEGSRKRGRGRKPQAAGPTDALPDDEPPLSPRRTGRGRH